MSKKKKIILPPSPIVEEKSINHSIGFSLNKWMMVILAAVSFGLYANTFFNDYCLDDAMMITQNSITKRGFEGISEHINNDYLYGFRNSDSHDAASSRWRPLSLISFSIEIGVWGNNHPHRSHIINVLIFVIIVILIFLFLEKFILKNSWLAFFSALLFAIHPVHTEVVANIKGRDELLCLCLVLSCLYLFWKFIETEKAWAMFLSMLLFFLSLTAKENGITLLAGVPVMIYFFRKKNLKQTLLYCIPFFITTILYLFIRKTIVPFAAAEQSKEIMNNPFLLMTSTEKLATKIFILLLYLKLLVFPYPLSYDYSFNQIQPHSFSNISTIASLTLLVALAIIAFRGIAKKNIFSFCIILFFITFSVSTNLIVEIGMTLGERLLFFPSLFFCVAMIFLVQWCLEKIEKSFSIHRKYLVVIFFVPVFLICSIEIFARNQDWKNDNTLNLSDIHKSGNSARVNNGTGSTYILLSDTKKSNIHLRDSLLALAINFYRHAIQIHPSYDDAYLNMGVAYSRMDSTERAEQLWNKVRVLSPTHPKLLEYDKVLVEQFYKKGMACGSRKSIDSAIIFLNHSSQYLHQVDSLYLECWYNIGGANFTAQHYNKAVEAFEKVIKISPNYRDANNGYMASKNKLAAEKLK